MGINQKRNVYMPLLERSAMYKLGIEVREGGGHSGHPILVEKGVCLFVVSAVVPWCHAVTQFISRHFHVCTPMVESYGVGIVYQLVGTYVETDCAGTKYKNCMVTATITCYGFVYL